MLKKKYLISIFAAILGLVSFFTVNSIVRADLAGEGLTISPPISELTLNKGEERNMMIRLTNPTGSLVEAYPELWIFGQKMKLVNPSSIQIPIILLNFHSHSGLHSHNQK